MEDKNDRSYVHHDENGLEKATNDLMGVSDANRGFWSGTDHETGNTAIGTTRADVDRKLDK